jgi:hypothetical protein
VKLAVYDMADRPATYDICPWLATIGAVAGPGPVRVVVLADRFRDISQKDKALPLAEKRARVERIIVPCCQLLPGATVDVVNERHKADVWRCRSDVIIASTFVSDCNRQHAAGRNVHRLHTTALSPHPGAVVFTIRQNPAVPSKNSNLDEWLAAASVLMAEGHEVVLIPDTAVAVGPLPEGFYWRRDAAFDVTVRAALYRDAACSLGRGVGPMAIAMFMAGTRYACFVDHSCPGGQGLFERVFGVSWGQQLPFAGPGQLIEYQPDTKGAILGAFRNITGRRAALN